MSTIHGRPFIPLQIEGFTLRRFWVLFGGAAFPVAL
jgi:hypothetical protein